MSITYALLFCLSQPWAIAALAAEQLRNPSSWFVQHHGWAHHSTGSAGKFQPVLLCGNSLGAFPDSLANLAIFWGPVQPSYILGAYQVAVFQLGTLICWYVWDTCIAGSAIYSTVCSISLYLGYTCRRVLASSSVCACKEIFEIVELMKLSHAIFCFGLVGNKIGAQGSNMRCYQMCWSFGGISAY